MIIIVFTVLYLILFAAVELITEKYKISKEISRKAVHISAGIIAAFLPLFMTFHQIALLSTLFIPAMLLSKWKNIFSSIHTVSRRTYGEVYFPLAILITSLCFPQRELYMYGILVMAISDGAASIFGQKYAIKKFSILGARKSYVGSFAFLIATLLIGLAVSVSLTNQGIIHAFTISLLAAVVLTLCEACLSKGLDNLLLPTAAALLLQLLS